MLSLYLQSPPTVMERLAFVQSLEDRKGNEEILQGVLHLDSDSPNQNQASPAAGGDHQLSFISKTER